MEEWGQVFSNKESANLSCFIHITQSKGVKVLSAYFGNG